MSDKLFNDSTRLPTPSDVRASVPEAASLFARAVAYLPVSPRHGRSAGYRVFWSEQGHLRFRDVVEHPRGFAVLGRHSQAHIRLLGDPTLALRHFVFRARRSATGVPELHVADLLAPLPLLIDGNDEAQHACAIEGAFSGRVGGHAIAAFPFDGCGDLDARGGPGRGDRPENDQDEGLDNEDDLRPDEVVGPAVYAPPGPSIAPRSTAIGPVPRVRSTSVRAVECAPEPASEVPRTSVARSVPRTTHVELLAREPPADAVVMVQISGAGGRHSIALSEFQLRGLVIVGRYDRCIEGGTVFSNCVSRMHFALSRVPGGVEVLDLASTGGMTVAVLYRGLCGRCAAPRRERGAKDAEARTACARRAPRGPSTRRVRRCERARGGRHWWPRPTATRARIAVHGAAAAGARPQGVRAKSWIISIR